MVSIAFFGTNAILFKWTLVSPFKELICMLNCELVCSGISFFLSSETEQQVQVREEQHTPKYMS